MSKSFRVEIDLTEYSESDLMSRIADQCADQIVKDSRQSLMKQVDELVKARMRSAADEIVADYLKRPLVKTNTYGEPTGQSVTLTEHLIDFFSKHMAEKVRLDGRKGDYYDKDQLPRIEWLVKHITTDKLEQAVRDAVAEARKKGEEAMRSAVADLLSKHLPK